MLRSFDSRIFGGVCGGLGSTFRLNPWIFRVLFVGLVFLNVLTGFALYIALWWGMPQKSLVNPSGMSFLHSLFLILIAMIIVGGWLYSRTGGLVSPLGQDLYLPIILLLLSLIFVIRQLRT